MVVIGFELILGNIGTFVCFEFMLYLVFLVWLVKPFKTFFQFKLIFDGYSIDPSKRNADFKANEQ